MKCPKTTWRSIWACDGIDIFIWNGSKSIWGLQFRSFLVFKLITCFLIEISHFQYVRNISNAPILLFSDSNGRMGYFKYFDHKKVDHFQRKGRDQFSLEKGPELISRFWGISIKNAYSITYVSPPSHAFRTFHITLAIRITYSVGPKWPSTLHRGRNEVENL